MNDILTYLFWPNPGNADYTSPKALALLIACAIFILGSFVVSFWRKKQSDQLFRRLSKSWAAACFWFGFTGLVMVVARVEQIQYIAMRVMWVVWAAALVAYIVWQIRTYRIRYYKVLPTQTAADPRNKYLPKRKKR